MITLSINYTLNGKSYNDKIRTKGSFSIDSIKREICSTLIFDEINPDEGIRENIIEDIQQLIMDNMVIQSIDIKHINIDRTYFIDTTIEKKTLDKLCNNDTIKINN